jgi:hypothetical protein
LSDEAENRIKQSRHFIWNEFIMNNTHEAMFGQSNANELLKSIFDHEKAYRGIDWLNDAFENHGAIKSDFVHNVLNNTLQKIANKTGVLNYFDDQLFVLDNAKLMDLIGFNQKEISKLAALKGEGVKVYLLELLHNLQQVEKELQQSSINWELAGKLLSAAGVIWTGTKFTLAVAAAMNGGATFVGALEIVIGASLGVATASIAAVVVVLIGFVLLMLKEAREYHLVINNTDYELRMYELYRYHGKVDILPTTDRTRGTVAISSRGNLQDTKNAVFGGIFGVKKKDGALVGAEGVVQLDMYNKEGRKHQSCTFLAYDVPLTGVFGGDNSCFVKCNVGNPSAEDFFKKNKKDIERGNTESSDSSGNIHITKRINSKNGSEAYGITVYRQQ